MVARGVGGDGILGRVCLEKVAIARLYVVAPCRNQETCTCRLCIHGQDGGAVIPVVGLKMQVF